MRLKVDCILVTQEKGERKSGGGGGRESPTGGRKTGKQQVRMRPKHLYYILLWPSSFNKCAKL